MPLLPWLKSWRFHLTAIAASSLRPLSSLMGATGRVCRRADKTTAEAGQICSLPEKSTSQSLLSATSVPSSITCLAVLRHTSISVVPMDVPTSSPIGMVLRNKVWARQRRKTKECQCRIYEHIRLINVCNYG